MEENFNKQKYTNIDTVSLIDLFYIVSKRKKLIMSITTIMTIFSYIYVNFVAEPVYSGSATIEIGQVINKDTENGTVQVIDLESNNFKKESKNLVLKSLIETKYGVSVSAINNSTLLEYRLTSKNKDTIKNRLNKAIKFTLERDIKRAKLYAGSKANIINTSIITPIYITNEPIKPKKLLIVIVTFITGLLFSIFLAFFVEFLAESKKRPARKVYKL